MALVPRPVSSIASGPFSACDTVPRPRSSSEPRPSSVRHRSAAEPLRPRRGIFLGGTGPPTSVFDRERPILRVRQFPDDCLRACGGHLPCATDPPPSVFARAEAYFWVALVPRPVSSIASDPSSACDNSPTSVLDRTRPILSVPQPPRPSVFAREGPFLGWHWSPDQCPRSHAAHPLCTTAPPAQRLRPRGAISWVALVPRPVSSIASDSSSACDSSPTIVFERAEAIFRVPQIPRPASSPARRHFSGWHWSPDQCLRSRAIHPPRKPFSRLQSRIRNRKPVPDACTASTETGRDRFATGHAFLQLRCARPDIAQYRERVDCPERNRLDDGVASIPVLRTNGHVHMVSVIPGRRLAIVSKLDRPIGPRPGCELDSAVRPANRWATFVKTT